MSQRRKNGNITSFFKPVAKIKVVSLPPVPQITEETVSIPSPPSPSPPPAPPAPASSSLLSDPGSSSPDEADAPLPTRDLEIPASDDDDDDDFGSESDVSLDDLTSILGRGRPVEQNDSPVKKLFATPRSKRSATVFHHSPLTFLPKHKFNIRALSRDAKKEDGTKESSTVAKPASDKKSATADEAPKPNGINKVEGPDARAVERSDGDQETLGYCFFKDYFIPPPSKPHPERLRGPWSRLSLADEMTRQTHFENRTPTYIQRRLKKLPDELFEWVLDELCVNKSFLFREECVTLITKCPEQIERLVTPQRLKGLFVRLGVSADLDDKAPELQVARLEVEPYRGRAWGCLESFLSLMATLALYMAAPSVLFACHALMRMSLDAIICKRITIFKVFQDAIHPLLHAVPRPDWADFCFAICSLIHASVKPQDIRAQAVDCLPGSYVEANDLRRRLALTFLLDDPELSRKHPDQALEMPKLVERFSKDDISLSPETDFVALESNLHLLNIVVDDGTYAKTDDPEDEKRFNEAVDQLAKLLKDLWKECDDSGMKLSQTELKSNVELVRQRLLWTVRTKKLAKSSIFDLRKRRAMALAKQQQQMAQFLGLVEDEFVDARETSADTDDPKRFVDAKETPEEIEELKRSQGEL